MAIRNLYRWAGTLGTEWSQLTPTQSNWTLDPGGTAARPNYPQGAGDEAAFLKDASLTSDNGSAAAQFWNIIGVTVTLLSGHFEAGVEGAGTALNGLTVSGGALIVATVDGGGGPRRS